MTLSELLTLATSTLAQVPHHPAVTPELCAAICWQESAGDPNARGDIVKGHSGRYAEYNAHGLAQFHERTWKRFAKKRFACSEHAGVSTDPMHRDCPRCAIGALINELSYAARNANHPKMNRARNFYEVMARFHNSGSLDGKRTAYVLRVNRILRKLQTTVEVARIIKQSVKVARATSANSAVSVPKRGPRK